MTGPQPSLLGRRVATGSVAPAVAAVAVLISASIVSGELVGRGGSIAVRDAIVAAPEDATLERLARRPPPQPSTLTEPTCTRRAHLGCFAWAVRADGAGFDTVTATRTLLVTEQALDGSLVARSLVDGDVVWTAELARGFSSGVLTADRDLLVHVDGRQLTGRDVASGRERWRTDELGRFAPYRIHRSGDVLVVAGQTRTATGYDGDPPRGVAAGLDPRTGEVRWKQEAATASLAAGGVTVLTARGGQVRAYEPTGELRWQVEAPLGAAGGETSAVGHAVSIQHDGHGRHLYRLHDGAPIGYEGSVLVADEVHTFADVFDGRSRFVLLDERGEVWRVDDDDRGRCISGASLEATTVEISTCGGGRVTLDRVDGSLVARVPPPTTRADAFGGRRFGQVGPYELVNADPHAQAAAVVVTDRRTGDEIARLPAATHPVWRDPWQQDADLGGVLVLRSRRWLAALSLPERPWGGTPAVR